VAVCAPRVIVPHEHQELVRVDHPGLIGVDALEQPLEHVRGVGVPLSRAELLEVRLVEHAWNAQKWTNHWETNPPWIVGNFLSTYILEPLLP
jgi:hypothetical protein